MIQDRISTVTRQTRETDITLSLRLDGEGNCQVQSGVGFFDHMLELFTRHGCFDLTLTCKGDTQVDAHHTVEDIGLCLGHAFNEAAGDRRGICRYGDITLPMDETLILCAADASGRGMAYCDLPLPAVKVGDFDTELCEEFLQAFARTAGITLHVRLLCGRNTHHIIEGVFKALGRTLRRVFEEDPRMNGRLPSTKGVLDGAGKAQV